MEHIQAIKGMNDILPAEAPFWQRIEAAAREIFEVFGYREIRVPLMEKTDLFARTIGEHTDIVEKEMYTFPDRKGDLLTLRPEATAGVLRAFIENNLQADPLARKFYTLGPMFRHERPQKGRYRQFHQIDAEVFGVDDPLVDAEIMHMLDLYLQRVGIRDVSLHVNTLGCRECRPAFREALRAFLGDRMQALCPDCARRSETNPLRVFDCKVEGCKAALAGAPLLPDFICEGCRDHFARVKAALSDLGTAFEVNPRMVRGLDYYMRTTFEVVTGKLGSQNAVGGGGRYDGLMRDLGGPDLPGMGFALGMERIILLLQQEETPEARRPALFFAALGESARTRAFLLAQGLRREGVETEMDLEGRSLKAQMRRADRLRARFVAIIGEEEVARGEIQLRDMTEKTQEVLPLGAEALLGRLGSFIGGPNRREGFQGE